MFYGNLFDAKLDKYSSIVNRQYILEVERDLRAILIYFVL